MSDIRPSISVITASHEPRYLDECLVSLLAQTRPDWEWIVFLNAGARWRPAVRDRRIRLILDDRTAGVGAAKRAACSVANSDLLVELDHHDVLAPTAVEDVIDAFETNPDVGLVVSDTAYIADSEPQLEERFDPALGWNCSRANIAGYPVLVVASLDPSPHNMSDIWFAPSHVRAFRRSTYDEAGGYLPALAELSAHDLVCRMYQSAGVYVIARPLYLQRSVPELRQDLSAGTDAEAGRMLLYERHLLQNAIAWSTRNGLLALDVGAAKDRPDELTGLDSAGIEFDPVSLAQGIDLPTSSVGLVRAVDVLQRVPDRVALFNEVYRILAHGGIFMTMTPSTDGRGAFQDPVHTSFYNENAFWYFTDRAYADYVPGVACRFQVSRLMTSYPSAWYEDHDISYVEANLTAVKDGARQGGRLNV